MLKRQGWGLNEEELKLRESGYHVSEAIDYPDVGNKEKLERCYQNKIYGFSRGRVRSSALSELA